METRPAGVYGVSEASVVSGVGGGMSGAGPRGVRDSDRRRFLQVFQACDKGQKGYLSREDLKVAVVMLFGYKPSKIEVDTMMSDLVNGNTGGVRADEFVKLMALKRSAQMSFGDHRQIFSVFDTHCRGFLNLDDFKRAFNRVAPHLSEQTVIEAFREVDGDSDGLVCYKDFEYVMNYGEDED
ncbi:EF-hand calcium-binding domain-containing protein 11 isoform X1 [Hyla sarda]|uniref:EF-hand calcium-binding domain-containing protein 11 isoform X1 n=1 Tax=Hyla sarda TaxID=327740 RepID=UPI0024C3A04A|nr:EF-hand calcium-binding domain-containing protein 11 isoform X1 [Hyla sarda]